MATIILHDEDVFRLAASVNAKQGEGYAPAGGLLYSNGLYIQPMATGDAADPYVIVREQETQNFAAKATGSALGSIQFVDGFFIQAFGSAAGSGGPVTVAWGDVTGKPAVIGAGATQAAARTAIGAGTSNLALGTTSTTAKAGDYAPTWAQVTGKPAVIAAGVDAAAARTAIGAGTSSVAVGTGAANAMAGNKVPTATERGGVLLQAAQAASVATDVAGAVADLNALLVKLRAAGIITP